MLNKTKLYSTREEKEIIESVINNIPITDAHALYLFEESSVSFCSYLANYIKEKRFGKKVFYNKNTHIEATNICENKCKFCSFYREKDQDGAWIHSLEDILKILKPKIEAKVTEIHFTGGLNPNLALEFYSNVFTEVKKRHPNVHIKAFTAVEIEYLCKVENKDTKHILKTFKESGLNSLAGGGAEILDDKVREILCPEKTSSEDWLRIHKIAHEVGLSSNCTMLFGHCESYQDRITHFRKLRELQEQTNGFNCFIPLKYKYFGNVLEVEKEVSLLEEMKNYAISRIYLHNIPHLKAYWPMCGKENALLALSFGADDFDGTIGDSTKIYSMAGSKEQNPSMTESEIIALLKKSNFSPVERDSLYNEI